MSEQNTGAEDTKGGVDEKRREFLRKSAYAAYATPVIMSMLVSKASATNSVSIKASGNNNGNFVIPPGLINNPNAGKKK